MWVVGSGKCKQLLITGQPLPQPTLPTLQTQLSPTTTGNGQHHTHAGHTTSQICNGAKTNTFQSPLSTQAIWCIDVIGDQVDIFRVAIPNLVRASQSGPRAHRIARGRQCILYRAS